MPKVLLHGAEAYHFEFLPLNKKKHVSLFIIYYIVDGICKRKYITIKQTCSDCFAWE